MCNPNFENPQDWSYTGGVLNYSSGSELEAEIADMLLDDIEEAHGRGRYSWISGSDARKKSDPDSRFAMRGTCDHCGAAFKFGAMFTHKDTGQIGVVGHICAVRTLTLDASEVVLKAMKQQAKAITARAKGDARLNALAPNRRAAMDHDHHINRDMRSRFRKWGRRA
jgi:hypothetical protein